MATLKDIWNYPNNPSQGYVADTANWSGDNSYGVDKRVEDFLIGGTNYQPWEGSTGDGGDQATHPRDDFALTSLQGSQAIAKYKHYFDSWTDASNTNLHFAKMHYEPLVTFASYVNGVFVTNIERITDPTDGAHTLLKYTTNTPHGFVDGQEVIWFGFEDQMNSKLSQHNWSSDFVKVVDSTKFYTYEDSSLTIRSHEGELDATALDPNHEYYLIDYNGAGCWLCYSNIGGKQYNRNAHYWKVGDNVKLHTDHTGLTGTFYGTGVGQENEVIAIGSGGGSADGLGGGESFFFNKTITSETNYGTTVAYDIVSSASDVAIEVDLTDVSYAAVRTQLMTYSMHTYPYLQANINDNIATGGMGFCRLSLSQGTTQSSLDKTIASSLDSVNFYNWTYDDSTKMLKVYEDGLGIERLPMKAAHASNIQGEIQFINFWTQSQAKPGGGWTHTGEAGTLVHGVSDAGSPVHPNIKPEVGFQGQAGGNTLSYPLVGLGGMNVATVDQLFSCVAQSSGAGTWPGLSDLHVGVAFPTMYWPGGRTYSYQNSSNVKTYAAGNIDFTTAYEPDGSTVTPLTWTTEPVITPGVNASGYLTNSYTFTNHGFLPWSSLGSPTDADIITHINDPSASFWGTPSAYKFTDKADEYVAPTPYAEDVWDTNDEWTTEAYSYDSHGVNKEWPQHKTPSSIKLTQVQPSSTTVSQGGTKYVRASGIVRHQMEVSYPPMTHDDFRVFESLITSARGQATPFYFNLKTFDGKDSEWAIAFHRSDAERYKTTDRLKLRHKVTQGEKIVMVEGFAANEDDAILEGEYLIGNTGNGWLIQAISSTDSNSYGEAQFRVSQAYLGDLAVASTIWKHPAHVVVTLSEDSFEYDVGTDMLYRFTVKFDFDNWK